MMDRSDFAVIAQKTLDDYIAAPPEDRRTRVVRMTSGTSSGEPLIFIREIAAQNPQWFSRYVRSLLCVGNLPMRLGLALVFRKEAGARAKLLGLDNKDLEPSLEVLAKDFAPEMVMSFPSILTRAAAYLGGATVWIQSAVFTGEPLRPATRVHLKKQFPHAVLQPQYMIQEMGSVSSPTHCPYIPEERYHPAGGVVLGVLNPDEEGEGELLVSARVNDDIVLADYRYGDLVRIYREPCACGASVSFEIVGRKNVDFIRFGGATLRQEEFDRVFAQCGDLADEYRAEFSIAGEQGVITLFVYAPTGLSAQHEKDLRERFSTLLFLTPRQTLRDLVVQGIFAPLRVRHVVQWALKGYKDTRLTFAKE